jgi:methylmalonyl-CoA mutase
VQSFFAVGGIEVVVPEQVFEDVQSLAASFRQSPAPVACLCSSNKVYASMAGAASALKKAGAVLVYLTGPATVLKDLAPQDQIAVDRLLYEGSNALALLEEAHRALRVEELTSAAELEAEEEGFETHVHSHHEAGCC